MSKRRASTIIDTVPEKLIHKMKPSSISKSFDFKIISWNVASFKACLKKGFNEYFLADDPDIICLQETKCDEHPPFSNHQSTIRNETSKYRYYWHCNVKPGYAGISTWSKIEPKQVIYGIENDETDQGRVITLELEDMYVINAYVPNSGDKLVRLDYRRKWNKDFESFLKKLDASKPIMLCGDLNVAHNAIDLARPANNKRSAGFTDEERKDFTQLLSHGFVDSFRYLYPDISGAYTYWDYRSKARDKNIGWRLDYFVVSTAIIERVVDVVVRDDVYGSDHCPIVLFMKNKTE